jgi:hypothetical protein
MPDNTGNRDYRPELACDAPEENKTVKAYLLSCKWLPKSIKASMLGRLELGQKRYGKPLRMGWDKSDAYLGEEELDMLTYGLAGGYFSYVFIIGWFVWFRQKLT